MVHLNGSKRKIAAVGAVALCAGALILGWRWNTERVERSVAAAAHERAGLAKAARARRVPNALPQAADKKYSKARETVAAVYNAHPELLGGIASVPPFDEDAFHADPEAYLVQAVPARCFATAKPGKDKTRLEAVSQQRAAIATGQPTPLEVKGIPNAPVTFTSFDGGYFEENGLPTISVQADGAGNAVAHYVAGVGIEGDVNIVAGSPLAVGRQNFMLSVEAEL